MTTNNSHAPRWEEQRNLRGYLLGYKHNCPADGPGSRNLTLEQLAGLGGCIFCKAPAPDGIAQRYTAEGQLVTTKRKYQHSA